jgi:DNA adenine methylase
MAHRIANLFPADMDVYHEPFLGSGAVLATLAPERAFASDLLAPLMEIWFAVSQDPSGLASWYAVRRNRLEAEDKRQVYDDVRRSYNASPNGKDLVFLCRACYGGVVRFRRNDGHMSTPCGAHTPISSESFTKRVDEWHHRTIGTTFQNIDFAAAFDQSKAGDLIYCDPPYSDTQAILYGAQSFSLHALIQKIDEVKVRGVRVALSIDGSKKSGIRNVLHDFPVGLFENEASITVGRSMLRRFQMGGQSLEGEVVADRLLLTY